MNALTTCIGRTVSVLCLCASLSTAAFLPQRPDEAITIANSRLGVLGTGATKYDAGPSFGDILNNHFFPGLEDYRIGSYLYAKTQMDYFHRPAYTSMNPRQAQYMTIAFYVRGMIYLDHATGLGRHALAIEDFKRSIEWDPRNYLAHLALAHAYTSLGSTAEATVTLKALLSKPDLPAEIQQEAKQDLLKLAATPSRK